MAAGVTAISSTAADEAREELKEYNQSAIAAAKASGRQLPLDLKAPDSSTKLQRACTECETVIRKIRPTASLQCPRPVLFLSRPPIHGDSLHSSACLALGKLEEHDAGARCADGLQKEDVLVWDKGAKLEFGDAHAMYVGFRVEESDA